MEQRYFICEHCGNIVTVVKDKGVPVMCCGQKMTELIAGTSDGAVEKHLPVAETDKERGLVSVTVGATEHPMADVHFIEWISLQTEKGSQIRYLTPGEEPKVVFSLCEGDTAKAVFAYCNLHGLWKTSL